MAEPLDKNKTVWQRVNDMLRGQGHSGRELDELTATVHKHVLAEREDAKSAPSPIAGAGLIPAGTGRFA